MEKRRFRFLKKLSEGTFGKVYLAEMITENKFSKVVAIKVLHAKWVDHDEIVRRSRDEARVLGLLQHRNIINVIDLISIGGKCSVIMEYLDGVDLKTLINYCAKNNIRIPWRVIFDVVSSVASALDAAYNRPPLQGGEPLRLIHRDIKPSNIMLTTEADIKVLDFGTAQARFEDREAETQALAFGSAAYMSPERFLGDDDRISGDVYGLGVTLYELLYQGRYGKANVREDVFLTEQERRLDKLDFAGIDEATIERIKNLLRGMLAWDEKQRPELSAILAETEQLAQIINDGSLKMFSREIVSSCKQSLDASNGESNDTLEGEIMVEDGTETDASDISMLKEQAISSPTSSQPRLNIVQPEEEITLNVYEEAKKAAQQQPQQQVSVSAGAQVNTSNSSNATQKKALPIIPIFVAIVVLVGAAGAWLFLNGSENSAQSTEEVPSVQEEVVSKGDPGKTEDLVSGSAEVRLEILPEGATTVLIRGKGGIDYQYKWDGTGTMILKNAPAGLYQTRFENSKTKLPNTLFELKAGTKCSLILDVDDAENGWKEEC